MLWSTECYHSVHKTCFKDYAIKQMTTPVKNKANPIDIEFNKIYCPVRNCKKQVQDMETRDYLTAEEREQVEDTQLNLSIAANP